MDRDAGMVDQEGAPWAPAGHGLVEEWAREGLADHRRVDPEGLWAREDLVDRRLVVEWGQVALADRRREDLEVLAARWVPEGQARGPAY